MKNKNLPNSDTIVRYCKPKSIQENMKLSHSCFYPRKINGKDEYISVDWLEFHKKRSFETNLIDSVKTIGKKFSMNENGTIAILKVGKIKDKLSKFRQSALIMQVRKSHCGISYETNALLCSKIIVDECVDTIIPLKEVK